MLIKPAKSAGQTGESQKAGEAGKVKVAKEREDILLKGIEVAELSGSVPLRERAYQKYLAMSLLRSKGLEVMYQEAELFYNRENYKEAVEKMTSIAKADTYKEKEHLKIRQQAGDMALDALVLLKKDHELEVWAREMAGLFPSKKKEYMVMVVKSVLNQTAQHAKQATLFTKSSDETLKAKSLKEAWSALNRMPMESMKGSEKLIYLQNRLALAEKMHLFPEAQDAVDRLLALPKLPLKDRKLMVRKRVWLSEMTLDFKSAYKFAQTKHFSSDNAPSSENFKKDLLHLILLAELANEDYFHHYRKFILLFPEAENTIPMATRLVHHSLQPQKELWKYKPVLKRDPELFARLQLEIFAKERRFDEAKKALLVAGISETPAGKVLRKHLFFPAFESLQTQVQGYTFNTKTQRSLAFSLKRRDRWITKLEKMVEKTMLEEEGLSQFLTLSLLFKELTRFHKDILSLPPPKGLTEEEQTEYLSLLSAQAEGYQLRAQKIQDTLQTFWNKKTMAVFKQEFAQNMGDSKDLKNLFLKEVSLLVTALDMAQMEGIKAELVALLKSHPSSPSSTAVATLSSETQNQQNTQNQKTLNPSTSPSASLLAQEVQEAQEAQEEMAWKNARQEARKRVQQNPVNKRALLKLLSIERAHPRGVGEGEGSGAAMISYLEQRLDILDGKAEATKGVSL